MGGVPLADIALPVGHSTIQMTMRYADLVRGANIVANGVVDEFYASATLDQVPTDRELTPALRRVFNSRISS